MYKLSTGGLCLSLLIQEGEVRPEWIEPITEQVFARYPALKIHQSPGTVPLPPEMETGIRGIIQAYGTT